MRVLIFGTCYVDDQEKAKLLGQWAVLHSRLNPDCDLLLVDSASPFSMETMQMLSNRLSVLQLGDNIGHLARSGHDGWGRAFCAGLKWAIDRGYEYVAHIEGDSLCRVDVMKLCKDLQEDKVKVLSVPVRGTKHIEQDWVETGLMFFDVRFLRERRVVEAYNWQDGASKKYPHTPEWHLHRMLGKNLVMAGGNTNTIRDDRKTLTVDKVVHYDWISHAAPEMYVAFLKEALGAAA